MTRTLPIAIGLLLVLVLLLFTTTYTVNYHELAVRTRFGKPAGIERDAGLHLKLPFFIDQVTKLDTRLQLVESPLETVLTRDGQQVVVQAFLFWRIEDADTGAMQFFTAYGSIEAANRDLETQLQGALRAIGGYSFNDLIGEESKLALAEDAILRDLQTTSVAGVQPVEVGISQILLPPKTTAAVLTRMAEVQNTLAKEEETKGAAQAEAIKTQAATQADIIRAFARQYASQLEARGSAEAARYYEEMRKHADLAIFLNWLEALKAGLDRNSTIFLDTQHAPTHLMDLDAPVDEKGIPLPAKGNAIPAVQSSAAVKVGAIAAGTRTVAAPDEDDEEEEENDDGSPASEHAAAPSGQSSGT